MDWANEPLKQIGKWIRATIDLDRKKPEKVPEKIPSNDAGNKAGELFGLPEVK